MQQLPLSAQPLSVTRLNPLAFAIGFGVAGVVEILLFGTVMGAMSGMMGGSGGGWMHVSGSGFGGSSMMGGGVGFFVYALIWGFFGSAIAGGVAASIYNAVISRNA